MNKRKLKKAWGRIKHLPSHPRLLPYLRNKVMYLSTKLRKNTQVAHPSTIMLELSNRCNLRCTTCPREYAYGKEMDQGFMELSLAKKIIDETWIYLDSIGLTGMGETFMYPHLLEVVDYIQSKNKGIILSLSTNAMLPNFIEKAKSIIGKVDSLQISIDGLHEVYNGIRVNASFTILDSHLRELMLLCQNSKTDLMLNMVITKENYHQMYDMLPYCQQIGIRYIHFMSFNLAAVTDIDLSYYDFYQTPDFLVQWKKLEQGKKEFLEIEVTNWDFYQQNEFRRCPFPWTHFYVSWDGYVPPCCAKPFPKELHFGNVNDSGLMLVLNSPSFQQFRQQWYDNETPDFCHKCHFVDLKGLRPV